MRDPRRPSRATSAVVKRSVLIAGHPTSVSLEQAFWDGLKAVATARAMSVAAVVAEVDGARDAANLSSALRVHVLGHFRDHAAAPGGPEPDGPR